MPDLQKSPTNISYIIHFSKQSTDLVRTRFANLSKISPYKNQTQKGLKFKRLWIPQNITKQQVTDHQYWEGLELTLPWSRAGSLIKSCAPSQHHWYHEQTNFLNRLTDNTTQKICNKISCRNFQQTLMKHLHNVIICGNRNNIPVTQARWQ